MSGVTYSFEDFELDATGFLLRRGGEPVHVEPRAFDLLRYLLEHRNRVVPKHELLDSIWGDHFVGEAALTTSLRTARRAIGDSGSQQRLIRTAHGRGYQFVGQVTVATSSRPAQVEHEVLVGSGPAEAMTGADSQMIQFCDAVDGTRIAYATVGSGPPLVKAANWMTHLDLEWSTPVWSHWLKGLARNRQLIRYDERGCGLSDWKVLASLSMTG